MSTPAVSANVIVPSPLISAENSDEFAERLDKFEKRIDEKVSEAIKRGISEDGLLSLLNQIVEELKTEAELKSEEQLEREQELKRAEKLKRKEELTNKGASDCSTRFGDLEFRTKMFTFAARMQKWELLDSMLRHKYVVLPLEFVMDEQGCEPLHYLLDPPEFGRKAEYTEEQLALLLKLIEHSQGLFNKNCDDVSVIDLVKSGHLSGYPELKDAMEKRVGSIDETPDSASHAAQQVDVPKWRERFNKLDRRLHQKAAKYFPRLRRGSHMSLMQDVGTMAKSSNFSVGTQVRLHEFTPVQWSDVDTKQNLTHKGNQKASDEKEKLSSFIPLDDKAVTPLYMVRKPVRGETKVRNSTVKANHSRVRTFRQNARQSLVPSQISPTDMQNTSTPTPSAEQTSALQYQVLMDSSISISRRSLRRENQTELVDRIEGVAADIQNQETGEIGFTLESELICIRSKRRESERETLNSVRRSVSGQSPIPRPEEYDSESDDVFIDDEALLLPPPSPVKPNPAKYKTKELVVAAAMANVANVTMASMHMKGVHPSATGSGLVPVGCDENLLRQIKVEKRCRDSLEKLNLTKQKVKYSQQAAAHKNEANREQSGFSAAETMAWHVPEAVPPVMKTVCVAPSLVLQILRIKEVVRELEGQSVGFLFGTGSELVSMGVAGTADLLDELMELDWEGPVSAVVRVLGNNLTAIKNIKNALLEIRQLFKAIKHSSLVKAAKEGEGNHSATARDLVEDGEMFAKKMLSIAGHLSEAAQSIQELTGGETLVLEQFTSGINLVLQVIELAECIAHLAKDLQSYAQMAEMKSLLKDTFLQDEDLSRIIDRDTLKTEVAELKQLAFESEQDDTISTDVIDEALRYYLIRGLKVINQKRVHREALKIFIVVLRLSGSIANLSVVGAEAGAILGITAETADVTFALAREAKRIYHHIADDEKSAKEKHQERIKQIRIMILMLEVLPKPEDPGFSHELARNQLAEIELLFKAAGLSLEAFLEGEVTPKKRVQRLYDALKSRE